MAHIVKIANQFKPLEETEVLQHPGGVTIARWVEEHALGFRAICVMDGHPVLRKDWARREIKPDSVVNFLAVQGEPLTIAYWVIAVLVVAAVAVALSLPKPTIPGELPEADPVYDLKGMRNQIRLGSPIEVAYGRNRLWPSYAARPYNQYINNEQFQFQLFCLGQGEFEEIDAFFEDTSINNFQDVDWEIVDPGGTLTLFPDNVLTSVEVANIELYGPNEATYTGLSGPYILNPSGTLASRLEVDIVLPLGLFVAGDNGKLNPIGMTALFEYQQIDDAGVAVGAWTELAAFHKILATNTPQRYTLGADVTPGRYQVRGSRVSLKDESTKAGNVLRWETARAFLPSTKDYGNVTLYALKTRATNNLNDNVSNRFNVIATRKLPIYDPNTETWSAPTGTRGIIPAFCDLFRNADYGGNYPDWRLDLEELWALHEEYELLGWTFDFVFEQRGTLWDAAKIVARVGRAIPMLNISQVTMIRDIHKTVPTAIYNQENIVKGSFRWDIALAELDDFDGVEVEYIDPTTHLPETVKCLVGDDAGENCEQIKFPGCKDRTRAYQEGIYYRLCRLHQRENVTFETGLEGRIPRYGDLIKVVHDMPRWGQGGLVLSISGTTVTLSEPVVFGSGTHKIGFRTKTGGVQGPYTVTAGAAANQVELSAPIDTSAFVFDDISERPLYYFGEENLEGILAKIVGLTPSEDTVEIKAVVVTHNVFECPYEPCLPPDPPDVNIPDGPPPNPTLSCTSVVTSFNPLDLTKLKVSWSPVIGAKEYHVERSADNEVWTDAGTTIGTFIELPFMQGETVYVRVKAVGSQGSGEWCYPDIGPGSPDNPTPPECDDSYYCLFTPVVPATVDFKCKERGGTYIMHGYSEYPNPSGPSLPPKKYLRKKGQGRNDYTFYPFGDCPTIHPENEARYSRGEFTGDYDPDTGVLTTVGFIINGTPAGEGPPIEIFDFGCSSSACGFVATNTRTQNHCEGAELTPECCSGLPNQFRYDGRDFTINLSNENREEDAIARLEATLTPWDDLPWVGCGIPCCESIKPVRVANEFSKAIQKARAQVIVTGLTASGLSVLEVNIFRENLTTGVQELYEKQFFATYADTLGGATWEFELPFEDNFKFYINSISFKVL